MKGFSREELKKLGQTMEGPVVSLYVATHEAGAATRENPIRFKNQIQEAERLLKEQGYDEKAMRVFLQPAYALVDDYDFWQHQRKGLGVFITNNDMHQYRLPIEVQDLTVVSNRPHLKPLLPLLTGDGRFYVLVTSMNQVKLLEGTRFDVSEVPLEDMPTSLSEFLKYDDFEENLQHHKVWANTLGAASVGDGRGEAMFHGHGSGGDAERKKVDILRFFQQIDNGIRDMLADERAPLVFAGVEYQFGIYKEANHYNYFIDHESVVGNFDRVRDEEIHQRAWEIVAPYFQQAQEDAKNRFEQHQGSGQTATNLEEIVPAAHDARVDTLFVPMNQHVWGMYDTEARTIERHDEEHAGDQDLLDLAAVQTILNGGTVYTVEPEMMPGNSRIAAIYRF